MNQVLREHLNGFAAQAKSSLNDAAKPWGKSYSGLDLMVVAMLDDQHVDPSSVEATARYRSEFRMSAAHSRMAAVVFDNLADEIERLEDKYTRREKP